VASVGLAVGMGDTLATGPTPPAARTASRDTGVGDASNAASTKWSSSASTGPSAPSESIPQTEIPLIRWSVVVISLISAVIDIPLKWELQ